MNLSAHSEFKTWLENEAASMNRLQVDPQSVRQAIQEKANRMDGDEAASLSEIASDPRAGRNERFLAVVLLGEGPRAIANEPLLKILVRSGQSLPQVTEDHFEEALNLRILSLLETRAEEDSEIGQALAQLSTTTHGRLQQLIYLSATAVQHHQTYWAAKVDQLKQTNRGG